MKRIAVLFSMMFLALGLNAQKYAWVDTQYILGKMPEYKAAQQKLDQMSEGWQKEADAMIRDLESLRDLFQREQFLLSDDMKQQRMDEISSKEKTLRDFQSSKFGINGELFQKRQELIKPIQDKIAKAIKDVAEEKGYAFIFDKSNSAFILYADPKLNMSDAVLKKLGL